MTVSLSDALRKRTHKQIVKLEAEVERLKTRLKNGKSKKPVRLTEQAKQEYLKDPTSCPYCESKDITGGFVDIHTGGAAQPVKCTECQRTWHDVYQLTNIQED